MNRHRLSAYLDLLIVSVIWGAAGPIIKSTLHDIPPIIFLTYRFSISALIATVFFAFKPHRFPHSARSIGNILLYSFLNTTVALGLLFFGFDKTTAITGTLIITISPIVIAITSAFILNEHVTHIERVGIALAFFGTIFTVVEPILAGQNNLFGSTFVGNVLIFLFLITTVVTAIQTKEILRENVDPLALSNFSFLIGFITILPISLYLYNPTQIWQSVSRAPLSAHLGVLYMAIISGTIGYALWNKGQKTIEVSEAGLFTYLQPLWATPLAVIWLKEKLTAPVAIGMLIIALGVGIAEYKRRDRTKTHPHLHSRHKRR